MSIEVKFEHAGGLGAESLTLHEATLLLLAGEDRHGRSSSRLLVLRYEDGLQVSRSTYSDMGPQQREGLEQLLGLEDYSGAKVLGYSALGALEHHFCQARDLLSDSALSATRGDLQQASMQADSARWHLTEAAKNKRQADSYLG